MNIIHIIYGYLRERQPPAVRFLHITNLCLVLSQIIVSNFMGFTDNGEVSKKTVSRTARFSLCSFWPPVMQYDAYKMMW